MRRVLITAAVLLLLIVAGVAWLAHLHGGSRATEAVPDTVLSVVYDTVTVVTPEPVQTAQLPEMVMRLPLWRGAASDDNNHARDYNLSAQSAETWTETCTNACTSPEHGDSADVIIPMERKVYEDSTYCAVITGAWVSLDTMQVYPRRETVTIRHPPDKRKRWGIGISAGYGMTPQGLKPFIGVTATYNLIRF